jgi:hypothetical protein
VKRLVKLRKVEAWEIWLFLKPKITRTHLQRLAKKWPGRWESAKSPDEVRIDDTFDLVHSIRAVLDEMKGEKTSYERPILGLATEDLFQLAEMLRIEVPEKIRTQRDFLNKILKKIQEKPK